MAIAPDGTLWERHGVQGASTAVLIHGLGLNQAVWQWMIPALADRYDVITYDLYGHGDSIDPPKTPSLSLFSRQLSCVMDAADVETAAIIGFSLGGMICRRFAQDYPDRVQALVVLNSPHRRTPEAQAAVVRRVDQAKFEGPEATVEDALKRWFTEPFRASNPRMMELVRGWVLANDKSVYPKVYRVLAEGVEEIISPNPPLRLPALALTADEDLGNNPEMSKAIAAEIDGGELLILPGLRHMALAENPNAVNTPVRAFLDRVLI
ncbi:MAG: alpha/beta hydrolase [Pseudomonadota bacterium]